MIKHKWWDARLPEYNGYSRMAITKGMLARGDNQQSIAAWWGGEINSGRVNEIARSSKPWVHEFDSDHVAATEFLPPPGPYVSGHHANRAWLALQSVDEAFDASIKKQQAAQMALRRAMKALKEPFGE